MMLFFLQALAFLVPAQADLPGPDAVPVWAYVLIGVGMTFGGALIALLKIGLGKLTDYLADKTGLLFLTKVDEMLLGIVTAVYQDQVEGWKKASADGKLTKAECELAKATAISSLKRAFKVEELEDLFDVAADDLNEAIGHRVELAKTKAQNAGKAARAGAPANPMPG